MNLMAEVKYKNNQLSLQNIILQQHLSARLQAPEFSSFLLTFVIAPFVVGAVARLALSSDGSASYRLFRAGLSGWRGWPLF